jgi:hypothetical protein
VLGDDGFEVAAPGIEPAAVDRGLSKRVVQVRQQIGLGGAGHDEGAIVRAALDVVPALGGQAQLLQQEIDLLLKWSAETDADGGSGGGHGQGLNRISASSRSRARRPRLWRGRGMVKAKPCRRPPERAGYDGETTAGCTSPHAEPKAGPKDFPQALAAISLAPTGRLRSRSR